MTLPQSVIEQLRASSGRIVSWAVNIMLGGDASQLPSREVLSAAAFQQFDFIRSKIHPSVQSGSERLLRECERKNIVVVKKGDDQLKQAIVILGVLKWRQPLLWQELVTSKKTTKAGQRRGRSDKQPSTTAIRAFCIPEVIAQVNLDDVHAFCTRAQAAFPDVVEQWLKETAGALEQKAAEADHQHQQQQQQQQPQDAAAKTAVNPQQRPSTTATEAAPATKVSSSPKDDQQGQPARPPNSAAPTTITSSSSPFSVASKTIKKLTPTASAATPHHVTNVVANMVTSRDVSPISAVEDEGEERELNERDANMSTNLLDDSSQMLASATKKRQTKGSVADAKEESSADDKDKKGSTHKKELDGFTIGGHISTPAEAQLMASPATELLEQNSAKQPPHNDNERKQEGSSSQKKSDHNKMSSSTTRATTKPSSSSANTTTGNKNLWLWSRDGLMNDSGALVTTGADNNKSGINTTTTTNNNNNNNNNKIKTVGAYNQDGELEDSDDDMLMEDASFLRSFGANNKNNSSNNKKAAQLTDPDDVRSRALVGIDGLLFRSPSKKRRRGRNSAGAADDDEDEDEDDDCDDDDIADLADGDDGEKPARMPKVPPNAKCYICGFAAVRRVVINNTSQVNTAMMRSNINNRNFNSSNTNANIQNQSIGNNKTNNKRRNTLSWRNNSARSNNQQLSNQSNVPPDDMFLPSVNVTSLAPFASNRTAQVVGRTEAASSLLMSKDAAASGGGGGASSSSSDMMSSSHHGGSADSSYGGGKKNDGNTNNKGGNNMLLVDVHRTAMDEWKDDADLVCCKVCGLYFHFGCIFPSRRRRCASNQKNNNNNNTNSTNDHHNNSRGAGVMPDDDDDVCTRCIALQLRDVDKNYDAILEDYMFLLHGNELRSGMSCLGVDSSNNMSDGARLGAGTPRFRTATFF